MNYIYQYPPNTKSANAILGKVTMVVMCPHCGELHHHRPDDRFSSQIKAPCCEGYYVVNIVPQFDDYYKGLHDEGRL